MNFCLMRANGVVVICPVKTCLEKFFTSRLTLLRVACALIFWAEDFAKLGHVVPRERGVVSAIPLSPSFETRAKARSSG
jgi:hypothetical protein